MIDWHYDLHIAVVPGQAISVPRYCSCVLVKLLHSSIRLQRGNAVNED